MKYFIAWFFGFVIGSHLNELYFRRLEELTDEEDHILGQQFMLGNAKPNGKLDYAGEVTIMQDPDGSKVVAVLDPFGYIAKPAEAQ